MKHIKKFNEELSPKTYRDAASGLANFNKQDRANTLLNYADKLEFGYYNITLSSNNINCIDDCYNFASRKLVFTEPVITNIYYGTNNYKDEEELVNNWYQGFADRLSLIIEFGFRLSLIEGNYMSDGMSSNKTTFKSNSNYKMYNDINNKMNMKRDDIYPIFALTISLASGIVNGNNLDALKLYQKNKLLNLYLTKPYFKFFGIFSDRISALSFRKKLPSLINDDVKERIMDILNIVGGSSKDYENILESINNIRVNGLYEIDNNKLSQNIRGYRDLDLRWYYKNLLP